MNHQTAINRCLAGYSKVTKPGTRFGLLRFAPRALGIVILVLLAILGVDLLAGVQSLGRANLQFVIAAIALFWVSALGRAIAWILLASAIKLGYRRIRSYVRLYLAGMYAGMGLPQGTASLTRLAVIAADKRSVSRAVVAIGADRLIQFLVIVGMLLTAAVYLSVTNLAIIQALGALVGLLLAVSLTLVVAAKWLRRWPVVQRVLRYRRVQSALVEAKSALREFRHLPASTVLLLFAMTLATSLATVTSLFLAARSLGLGINFPVMALAWAAIAVSSLAPISVSGFGPREGILTAALAGSGLNSEGGVALGLMWFFMRAVTGLTATLIYLTLLHANVEPIALDSQSLADA